MTTSEFVSQEDIEMTTTHDDLSLFQISFCIDGNMEWSYINNEVVHQFQIAAQQSQVRYGTFKECRSKISGNRKFKGISITLDEKIFEQIFTCIKIRGALYDTRKTAPVRVYTYTPNISKILSEILACHFCDEMKKIYLQCYSNLNHTSAAHTTPPVTGVLPLCTRLRRVRRNNPPWRSL